MRIKPQVGKLESLDDVNLALRDIGLKEKELDAIDSKAAKEIAEIKTRAAKDGEDLRKEIAETAAKIQAYAEYNKEDLFKDKKSVDLSFGKIGYRQSTKISVKKTTLELLKKLGFKSCVRIKEECDKDAMGNLSDDDLKSVDAARKVSNDFFCEANMEEVNKDLLKQA
jgi:phage host-nuclease inhibitor protein Gam